MTSATVQYPVPLRIRVRFGGRTLTFHSNGVTWQKVVRSEVAEWIWQDLLPGLDRKGHYEVPVEARLTERNVMAWIGPMPSRWLVLVRMHPADRGILLDRQLAPEGIPWKELVI